MKATGIQPVMAKLCEKNFYRKIWKGPTTVYVLTDDCHNAIEQAIRTKNGNINEAITYVVNWFLTKTNIIQAKSITTESGKKFVKVQSTEELDAVSKQAIDNIMAIINQNKQLKVEKQDLETEIDLLKGEIERLKKFEDKYNQIKQLTK
jgi:acetamidase/formamidase